MWEQGWGSSPTSGPSPVPVKLPLCYYYGLPSPEDNAKLFKPVLTRLALAATSRLTDDTAVRETGMIIDTPGVISQGKGGYDIISHIVSEFSGPLPQGLSLTYHILKLFSHNCPCPGFRKIT